ncbi:MAG: hypothetical protein GXO24_03475 [Chlorobi bacterium]|nr:hypothetical protein [Chlorobiota bacterium]
MKITFLRLWLFIMAAGLLTASCKKKEECPSPSTFELLTMGDWHMYNEKVTSSSGTTELPQDTRWVFTVNRHYYYYLGQSKTYREEGVYELKDDTDPPELHFTKTNGVQLIYKITDISEDAMKWEYKSGDVTYTFYFER